MKYSIFSELVCVFRVLSARHFYRVWQRNRDVFFKLWHTEAVGFIAEPVILILAFGTGLGALVGVISGQTYIEFIVPGIVVSYAMYSATFECTYGSYVRMEYQKTYDAILSTPLNAQDIIAGEIFWGATRAAMTGTAILGIATAFQLVHSPWALLIPFISFLTGLVFSCISMFFTSMVPTMYAFNYYFSLFITPMFFFSGVYFPLSQFPQAVQTLSWIAPLTPVVNLSRAAINDEFEFSLLGSLGIVLLWILTFFTLALIKMKRRLSV